MPKLRVDVALQARGLAESREAAQRLITAGRVRSGTTTFVKASQMVDADAPLSVTEPERYVSRGGLKLEGALSAFGIDPSQTRVPGAEGQFLPVGLVCLDLGASTGGFTDCLLQHGASHVVAVDVGRAQLHQRLREDPRVTLMEGVNARALPELRIVERRLSKDAGGEDGGVRATLGRGNFERRTSNDAPGNDGTSGSASFDNRQSTIPAIGLFVADLSFISLRKVLPSVAQRLAPGTPGIVLLKPQFEAGPKDVPRGGVIKDAAVLERVRREFVEWLEGNGWRVYGMIASPIRGGDGNTEYLVHIQTPAHHRDTEAQRS